MCRENMIMVTFNSYYSVSPIHLQTIFYVGAYEVVCDCRKFEKHCSTVWSSLYFHSL
jgi:hypothetical protein